LWTTTLWLVCVLFGAIYGRLTTHLQSALVETLQKGSNSKCYGEQTHGQMLLLSLYRWLAGQVCPS